MKVSIVFLVCLLGNCYSFPWGLQRLTHLECGLPREVAFELNELIKFLKNCILDQDLLESNSDVNPEELSGQFEGDIVLNYEQWNAFNFGNNEFSSRTGLINTKYRWPDNVVPYELSNSFGNIKFRRKFNRNVNLK